ncbi:di-heme oxidoredictase family protein, partial [Pseudoalteromonas phenolica]|uniref:di-heme oxidoredictase family protein n=1 Tax=Pseudoalteromonas phenolica TaxID=161398 RepID=UPI00128507C0
QRCEGLADCRPEGDASGTEWKTPALWGLGLVQTVTPIATFLHDGPARTLSH